MVNIFDHYKVIKDKKGYINFDNDLLEKLDAMLTEYDVPHAFSECRNEDIAADENSILTVYYNDIDDTKFFLVYALFIMTYRNADDEMIKKAMSKHIEF